MIMCSFLAENVKHLILRLTQSNDKTERERLVLLLRLSKFSTTGLLQ